MVQINWSEQALFDMQNIAAFISKDSKKFAEIQNNIFLESVEILENFPKSGRIVPEIGRDNIRELI